LELVVVKETPLRFGVFQAPIHKIGTNPHLNLMRDIEIAEHLDRLGYDEIWYGEHHSSASETIASPELMIAAAAQRTSRIRLGTGVSSLPYHNPYILADRIVQLDHITRGRMMFGAGPGQLLQDAQMLGIQTETQRARMEEALQIMLRLFAGERVTHESDWITLREAELQHAPFSDFEVAVTAIISPTGPKLAGRLGLSLLSLGSVNPAVVDILADHWRVLTVEAEANGHAPDRSAWRLLGQIFVADSMDAAIEEVRFGLAALLEHGSRTQPGAPPFVPPTSIPKLVDELNESGAFVIGTPDMAVRHLERLQEKTGGFGCYLMLGADIARWPAMLRHYELMAEEVIPHFNGQLAAIRRAYKRYADSGTSGADATAKAQAAAKAAYDKELAARGTPR
jgi:limonene 1,2-monooxygenase